MHVAVQPRALHVGARQAEFDHLQVGDIEALREALVGDDVEAISEKSAALSQSMMKMGEAAYNAEGDPADAEPAATNTGDESVVDAEFEEVDAEDDKKS